MDDLRRLESQFESLKKEALSKDGLLKIAAHDLLSPVTSMSGLIKLLQKPDSVSNLDERQLNIIQTLDRAMDQYLSTVTNIMELSRILRGKLDIKPADYDLCDLVRKSVERANSIAMKKGVSFNLECDENTKAYADMDSCERILARLLENAFKFSNPGDAVDVSCFRDGKYVAVQVKDHGVGIDKKTLDCIFEIGDTHFTLGTDGEKGSGMGLCIARQAALLNGGELTLESSLGNGTTVRLLLPAPGS